MSTKEKIKSICNENKTSIAELERELGFGNGSLMKSSSIKAERLQAIAEYFNVPVTYFYDDDEPYYIDPETAKLAEELASNPGMRILFDAARDVPAESLKAVAQMLEQFKKTNPEG